MKKEFFVVQYTDMPDELADKFATDYCISNDSYVNFGFGYGEELDTWLKEQGATESDNILVEICW